MSRSAAWAGFVAGAAALALALLLRLVTGIPALNVYKGGELVKSIVGAQPKASLLRQLSEFIDA